MLVTEVALHLRKISMTIIDEKNRSVTEVIGYGTVFIEESVLDKGVARAEFPTQKKSAGSGNKHRYTKSRERLFVQTEDKVALRTLFSKPFFNIIDCFL